MTNKYNNWERILKIIEWRGITLNRLATLLGMSRVEGLYNIKRGNYGISPDLANRLCELFPQLDRTWLLSGVGSMLLGDKVDTAQRPYYRCMVEECILNLNELKHSGLVSMPCITGYDFVMRSSSRAMCDKQCAVSDLFLRSVEIDEIVQGNEYVLIVDGEPLWRKVRIKKGSDEWRLVARNRSDCPDIFISPLQVSKAWRVVARLAVMTS
ncbi:MAG: helix-turn-helix transcriptional regulator [Alistipes sp.]|nr:helix-turn-helix transcriptional regulator [Alistipes sp.]